MKRYFLLSIILISVISICAQSTVRPKAVPLQTDTTLLLYNVDFGGYLVGDNDWTTRASLNKSNAWKVRLKKYTIEGALWDGKTYLIQDSVENGENTGLWLNTFIETNKQIYTDQNRTTLIRDHLWTITKDVKTGYYTINPSVHNAAFNPSTLPNTVLGYNVTNSTEIPTIDFVPSISSKGTHWIFVDEREYNIIKKDYKKQLAEKRLKAKRESSNTEINFSELISTFHSDYKKYNYSNIFCYDGIPIEPIPFNMWQEIDGVPNGYYRVEVPAFCQNTRPNYAWFERDSAVILSELYANEMSIPLKNVMSEPTDSAINSYDFLAPDGKYYPAREVYAIFANYNNELTGRNHNNYLYCKVIDNTLRMGIRQNKVRYGCLTIRGDFKLYYLGTDDRVLSPAFELYDNEINKLNSICDIRQTNCKIDKKQFGNNISYINLKEMNDAVNKTRKALLEREYDYIEDDNYEIEYNKEKTLTNNKALELKHEYQTGLVKKYSNPKESRNHLINAITLIKEFSKHGDLPDDCGIEASDSKKVLLQLYITISSLYNLDGIKDSAEYYMHQATSMEQENLVDYDYDNIINEYKFNNDSTNIETFDRDSIFYNEKSYLCETALAYLDSICTDNICSAYSRILNTYADTKKYENKYDSALELYIENIKYIKEHNLDEKSIMQRSLEETSNIYVKQHNDYDKATLLILNNLSYFEKNKYYGELSYLYDKLARYSYLQKKYEDTEKYCLSGIYQANKDSKKYFLNSIYSILIITEIRSSNWEKLEKYFYQWIECSLESSLSNLCSCISHTIEITPKNNLSIIENIIDRCIGKFPDYSGFYDAKVSIKLKQHKYAEALEAFEQNPENKNLKTSVEANDRAYYYSLLAGYYGFYLLCNDDNKYNEVRSNIQLHMKDIFDSQYFTTYLNNAYLCESDLLEAGDTLAANRVESDIDANFDKYISTNRASGVIMVNPINHLGNTFMNQAQYKLAIKIFEKCIKAYDAIQFELDTLHYRHYRGMPIYNKAVCYINLEQMDKAKPLLDYSMKNHRYLISQDKQRFDKDMLWTISHIVNLYKDAGMLDEQLNLYNEWAGYCQRNDSVYGNITIIVDSLNELSYRYIAKKKYDNAIEAINTAIKFCPRNDNKTIADLYDSKGEILLMQGKTNEALQMWNKILELNPKFLEENPDGTNLYRGLKQKGLVK